MSVMRGIVVYPFTRFEFSRPSRSDFGLFSLTALVGPVTLTFELSTCKWESSVARVMGSDVKEGHNAEIEDKTPRPRSGPEPRGRD